MNDDIWETFCDECYYHMWRVRIKGERHFDEGFHVNNRKEAQGLVELLNGLERERDEAREALENHKAQSIHSCHDKCKRPMCVLRRERDEARAESLEQSRLLGMSGEREAKLLAQLAAERALADRLAGVLELYCADDAIAHHAGIADALAAWKEARND